MSIPAHARAFQRDAQLEVSINFPAAAAAANGAAIDLGHGPSTKPTVMGLYVGVPALAAHTDSTKTITAKLQDSADGSAFADVNPAVQLNIPGVATTGSLADEFLLPLPPNTRQYVRLVVTNPSGGPAVTASALTVGAAG